MRISAMLACVLMLSAAAAACAQNVTIQLPSFHQTYVDTTVEVPDSGPPARLMDDGRAMDAGNEFGQLGAPLAPRPRATSRNLTAAGVTATVRVHDLDALDRSALRRAAALNGRPHAEGTEHSVLRQPGRLDGPMAVSRPARINMPPDGPVASVEELRQRRADQATTLELEARRLYERGQQAELAGKDRVAEIYYRQAADRSTGPLREQINAALARFNPPAQSADRAAMQGR